MPTTSTRTPTRTTRARDAALLRATDPIPAEEFLAAYWERGPLHVARGEPGRFDDLLSAFDAERIVTEPGLRVPGFRLVRADERIAEGDYATDLGWRPVPFSGTADVDKVAELFAGGATIVLQGLHLTWLPLARFSRGLEARLGHPAQTNAYWTPRGSQGLPVHHDTHDVFVLQADGHKRWLVYEPVLELPLKHQRYRRELGGPGPVVLDVVLGPGDTLYLPRGWLHEALTSDEDSLHLTVGINVVTWIDALRSALARCEEDLEFRRALPADGVGAEKLVARLAERLGAEEVAGWAHERFVTGRRPILDGQLSQLRALDRLASETFVERRDTVIADVGEADDGGIALVFEGKRLTFPAHARAEVEAIALGDGAVRIGDLPGRLDEPGRLVLVRRLVREGFARLAD